MGRMLALLLGLAVVVFVAYQVVYNRGLVAGAAPGPKPALDQVRKSAARIEAQEAKRLDETLEKTAPTNE